jgi:hypothetical protein
VPDPEAREVSDIALGAFSIAVAVATRTTTLAARAGRTALGKIPRLRVRVRSAPLDASLRLLEERGRFERAVAHDRTRAAGARVVTATAREVLTRVDVTGLVNELVDLDRIASGIDVNAVAARLDIDQVIARLDLIGLARYVVDGIDLPDLIRDSTGSVTAEMVKSLRAQSVDADHAVERTIDRILLRGNGGRAPADLGIDIDIEQEPGRGDDSDE